MTTLQVPASIGQRLLAMIGHYRPDHGALNCPVLCALRGPLDTGALRAALDGLTATHEALRTSFTGRGRGLTQVVHPPSPQPLAEVALAGEDELAAAVDQELSTPIDVGVWPTRATLWRLGTEHHVLCLNAHHLVTDAWSAGLLFENLQAGYAQALGSRSPDKPPCWQYRHFVDWQTRLVEGGLDRHRDYWSRRLAGLELPRLPYRKTEGKAAAIGADLSPDVVAGLRQIARRQRTTLFTVMLALFYAVLRQTCGQDDLAVASLFANRSQPESRKTVGFLANMVVLRTRTSGRDTFNTLMRATHDTVAGALAYQEQPYQTLPLDGVRLGEGRADDVVFQMMTDIDHVGSAEGVDFELLVPEGIGSRFEVELAVAARERDMRVVLFHTARLPADTAADMLEGYLSAAAAVAGSSAVPLAHLGV
ncbi:condensation domain-containing protein [Nonomuraea sp. NPDC046802]|uniref:condensation domain-containing protein n=1 Tax=Nonomuraea sp. NPDC046802 TaxID=3154919 RepID=UPI0033C98D0C